MHIHTGILDNDLLCITSALGGQMNRDELGNLQESLFETIRELSRTKGNDYAGNEDALRNFKHHAKLYNVSPELIWGIYAGKHWDAVTTYIRDGAVRSEPIEGRIHDLLVYLTLLYGLVQEKRLQKTIERLDNAPTSRMTYSGEPKQ